MKIKAGLIVMIAALFFSANIAIARSDMVER